MFRMPKGPEKGICGTVCQPGPSTQLAHAFLHALPRAGYCPYHQRLDSTGAPGANSARIDGSFNPAA